MRTLRQNGVLGMTETIRRLNAAWSAMDMAKWLLVFPVAVWWFAIFAIQLLNPWFLQPIFGVTAIVIDVPDDIWTEAKWIIAYVIAGEVTRTGIDAYKERGMRHDRS